jgi:hypothetical protein
LSGHFTLGVPWITWIGYPSFAILFLLLWGWPRELRRGTARAGALLLGLPVLAVGHALGLQALKRGLGW